MMAGNPTPRPYWTPDAPVIRLTEQERTSYREQIRELVTGASLTFTWLIRQLSDEGLMTDKYEMSATRPSPSASRPALTCKIRN